MHTHTNAGWGKCTREHARTRSEKRHTPVHDTWQDSSLTFFPTHARPPPWGVGLVQNRFQTWVPFMQLLQFPNFSHSDQPPWTEEKKTESVTTTVIPLNVLTWGQAQLRPSPHRLVLTCNQLDIKTTML